MLTDCSDLKDQCASPELELYKEDYAPGLSPKQMNPQDRILPLNSEGQQKDVIADIEDLFVRTGERTDTIK